MTSTVAAAMAGLTRLKERALDLSLPEIIQVRKHEDAERKPHHDTIPAVSFVGSMFCTSHHLYHHSSTRDNGFLEDVAMPLTDDMNEWRGKAVNKDR